MDLRIFNSMKQWIVNSIKQFKTIQGMIQWNLNSMKQFKGSLFYERQLKGSSTYQSLINKAEKHIEKLGKLQKKLLKLKKKLTALQKQLQELQKKIQELKEKPQKMKEKLQEQNTNNTDLTDLTVFRWKVNSYTTVIKPMNLIGNFC